MDEMISRRAVLKLLSTMPSEEAITKAMLIQNVKYMSSAQPGRKRGKWIKVNGKTAINCSACYHCSWSRSFEDTVKRFNFCPYCGADMREDDHETD